VHANEQSQQRESIVELGVNRLRPEDPVHFNEPISKELSNDLITLRAQPISLMKTEASPDNNTQEKGSSDTTTRQVNDRNEADNQVSAFDVMHQV
jgi:hypothetical protein